MRCLICGKKIRSGEQKLCESCAQQYALPPASSGPPFYASEVVELIAAGKLSEAQQLCRDAIRRRPREADVYEASGDVAVAQAEWREAVMAYSSALQLHPADRNALQQKLDAAIEAMRASTPDPVSATPPAAPKAAPLPAGREATTQDALPVVVGAATVVLSPLPEGATPASPSSVATGTASPIRLIITPEERKPIIEESDPRTINLFYTWTINRRLLVIMLAVAVVIVLCSMLSHWHPWQHRYQAPSDVQAIPLDDDRD